MRATIWLWSGVFLVATGWTRPLPAADAPALAIVAGRKSIDFLIGDELVARYHFGAEIAKPYFWPLNGPGGVALTRDWPLKKGRPDQSTDHVHQKSAWFGHGDVIPEGMTLVQKAKDITGVDFWTEETNHGQIVCTEVGTPSVSRDHGQILTRNEWRTADGHKILDEARTIHLHSLGTPGRLLVVEIDLLASVVPITFGDTDEGSMGIRINDSLRAEIRNNKSKERKKGPGRIENSAGKVGESACWGYLADWCDFSGPLEGKVVGLAILSDPSNPHPACWQSRGYGLMAANPFGRDHSGYPAMKGRTDIVKLAKGDHLKLRYGILMHLGDAETGQVAEHFRRFATHPD
jgi:hypothetical protein